MAKSPKNSKGPSKSKADAKPALIIIALFCIGVFAFLFFNKGKSIAPETTKPPVVVEPIYHEPLKPVKQKPTSPHVPKTPPVKKYAPGTAGKIAFITDDWGQSLRNCKYLKEIPDPLAIAILPELPNSIEIAKCASVNNKVIMLHLPLEALHNSDPYPVDYIIKTSMKAGKIEKILNKYLSELPMISGVNNHMGSKVTENKDVMTIIIKRLKRKGLFYVDSMTAPDHSVAWETAEQMNLPYAKRDVFLDNINTREEILKQINRLAVIAHKKGSAIAIGHDRELTLKVLKEEIPLLKDQGFEIVSIKDLLKNK